VSGRVYVNTIHIKIYDDDSRIAVVVVVMSNVRNKSSCLFSTLFFSTPLTVNCLIFVRVKSRRDVRPSLPARGTVLYNFRSIMISSITLKCTVKNKR